MNGKVARGIRRIAREMAGDNEALYKVYCKEAKRIHKKVSKLSRAK